MTTVESRRMTCQIVEHAFRFEEPVFDENLEKGSGQGGCSDLSKGREGKERGSKGFPGDGRKALGAKHDQLRLSSCPAEKRSG